MDLQEYGIKYGYFLGKRYKEKDKLHFIEMIAPEFSKLGYKVDVRKKEYKRFSGMNVYIGDVVTAKNLIIAPYDTPPNAMDKNIIYYPFDRLRSERNIASRGKTFAFLSILTVALTIFFLMNSLQDNMDRLWLAAVILTVIGTVVGYLFIRGYANPFNVNLNTSGVIALLALAQEHPKDTAFILTDREFVDNLGNVMIQEALPSTFNDKKIIELKGIGRGDTIVVGYSESSQELAQELAQDKAKIFELKDQALALHTVSFFAQAVSVSVAKEVNGAWGIEKTCSQEDRELDEIILQEVYDLLNQFLA